MAEPTKAELAGELAKRVQELEKALDTFREVTEFRLKQLEALIADRARVDEQLTVKQSDSTARIAVVEERCRVLEKQSDRGWQLWLAALAFGFGLLNLVITAALQLRK